MPATSKEPKRLSDADLQQLLSLLRGADSTELKLTVPDSEQRSAVAALGMDPLDAQIRQVYFFDTPELALNRHGLVVRARRVQQKPNDSVVKLRVAAGDRKLKFSPQGYDRRLVAELWLYPDGSRILELSTKCTPAEAFGVAAETRAFLAEQGVDLSGEQQTKTSTALKFFSGNLKAATAGR